MTTSNTANDGQVFDTRKDLLDFRDRIYQPALVRLAPELIPDRDLIEILDQQREGACTGFGLAATINYLNRVRGIDESVSPRMLYEMAKQHDRWPGENYEGSSARGAVKGWHKNGVCPDTLWPYKSNQPGFLNEERQRAALRYPLGAYYRVLPRRSDLHAALNETGALFATAATHTGWVNAGATIPFDPYAPPGGGHAFVILGYTDQGFLIQNSWGESWGGWKYKGKSWPGLSLWSYEDCEKNLWDAWVARMALPVVSLEALGGGRFVDRGGSSQASQSAPPRETIRNHYIHIDDGRFASFGDYPSSLAETEEIVDRAMDAKHLLFYAHGGLNDVKGAAARVGKWRPVFEANGIHEIHFIWETGLLEELGDVLRGKRPTAEARAGGIGDWWDRWIERLSFPLGGPLWKEMISGARSAFRPEARNGADAGAGSEVLALFAQRLAALPEDQRPKLHLAGHSAGSILAAYLLERWHAAGGPGFERLILLAPACTHTLFESHIKPALRRNTVAKCLHFLLDDQREQDDNVAQIYRKSLLYLVSRSFQQRGAVVPLMGMEHHLEDLPERGVGNRIQHRNTRDDPNWTQSDSHGGFDNDRTTMNNMLEAVLGDAPTRPFEKDELKGY